MRWGNDCLQRLRDTTILSKKCHNIQYIKTKFRYPKLWGNSKNCPAAKDSAPETEVISFLSWLLSIKPGRSVDSVCVMTGLARVGLVSRITETKHKFSLGDNKLVLGLCKYFYNIYLIT